MARLSFEVYTGLSVLGAAVAIGSARSAAKSNELPAILAQLFATSLSQLAIVNFLLSMLVVLCKAIQYVFFGPLYAVEREGVQKCLSRFVLVKLGVVFVVFEPPLNELFIWILWFSVLGCFKSLAVLARLRFERLVSEADATFTQHAKTLSVLGLVLVGDAAWFALCYRVFASAGPSIMFLLTFECFMIANKTLRTVGKYAIHLASAHSEVDFDPIRAGYLAEFACEGATVAFAAAHYAYVWLVLEAYLYSSVEVLVFFSMYSAITRLLRQRAQYRFYLHGLAQMMANCTNATREELEAHEGDCGICMSELAVGTKLPCDHIFHQRCIRQWFTRSVYCPLCRYNVQANRPANADDDAAGNANGAGGAGARAGMPRNLGGGINIQFGPNGFRAGGGLGGGVGGGVGGVGVGGGGGVGGGPHIHPAGFPGAQARGGASVLQFSTGFNGWMPHFSVNVGTGVNIDGLVADVVQMFPNVSEAAIREDLQRTRSADITIDNILAGRIPQNAAEMPGDGVAGPAPADDDGGAGGSGDVGGGGGGSGVSAAAPTTSTTTTTSTTSSTATHTTTPASPASPAATAPAPLHPTATTTTTSAAPAPSSPASPAAAGSASASTTTTDSPERGAHITDTKFAESPDERAVRLAQKKESMREEARRRFLAKKQAKKEAAARLKAKAAADEGSEPAPAASPLAPAGAFSSGGGSGVSFVSSSGDGSSNSGGHNENGSGNSGGSGGVVPESPPARRPEAIVTATTPTSSNVESADEVVTPDADTMRRELAAAALARFGGSP